MTSIPLLGIDIALATLEAALRLDEKRVVRAAFANTPGGFRQLLRWLSRHFAGHVIAGVESTSTYAEALLHYLSAAGHEVHLLNPERVACYARSRGLRNKTDSADATMIAAFLVEHRGTPWTPPPPEQKTLRELTRARAQLVATQKALAAQVKTAGPAAAAHLKQVLRAVSSQLLELMHAIKAQVRAHPPLNEQVQRLMTMKGVGFITAAVLVAELPPITAQSDPRSIAGWAGLTPRRYQSGKLERPAHLSRKGNAYVRDALYMPALVARRYNPVLHAFAQRLKAKGKRSGAILGAIAHKMLRILVGLLKSKTNFDPNWAFQIN